MQNLTFSYGPNVSSGDTVTQSFPLRQVRLLHQLYHNAGWLPIRTRLDNFIACITKPMIKKHNEMHEAALTVSHGQI